MPVGKKANGQLKKGYRYAKGGRVVKAKENSSGSARKRKTARRRKGKKFLGIF